MLLNVVEIEKYYGTRNNLKKALDRVSFSVNSGDFVSIMGASGSGKTTLLNCISTIDSVSSGHIYLGEQDLTTISSAKMAAFRREAGHHDFCQALGCGVPVGAFMMTEKVAQHSLTAGDHGNHLRR